MIIGHSLQQKVFSRLIKENRLAGSFIFFGEPQVGKFTFAKFLSETLEPQSKILSETLIIQPNEKETIGIDKMRDIKKFLIQKPINALRRTVIINDAWCLTSEAQNAILKITEEPPSYGLIILILPNFDVLAPTLVSRCRLVYFSRISTFEIAKWLMKKHKLSQNEAQKIALESFGRPGLAETLIKKEKPLKKEELISIDDYRCFVKGLIIELYQNKIKNSRQIAELLKRLQLMEGLNTNKKLQLETALWTR